MKLFVISVKFPLEDIRKGLYMCNFYTSCLIYKKTCCVGVIVCRPPTQKICICCFSS